MLPEMKAVSRRVKTFRVFGGLDFTDGCPENALSEAENILSDGGVLTVRRKRAVWHEAVPDGSGGTEYTRGVMMTDGGGITAAAFSDGKLAFTAGASLYFGGHRVTDADITAGKHEIVPFGRGIFVLPENIFVTPENGTPAVTQTNAPDMDFAVCRGNRLFGCRFGTNADGDFVNEIYVSKQGDPTSWFSFEGISTDSFAASLGVPGAFTGAAVCGDRTVFFKEDALIFVAGNTPAEFTVTAVPCDGAEEGAARSVVNAGDSLYYKSRAGICVFDGAFPRVIANGPPRRPYTDICAGASDGKYYIAMTFDGKSRIHVYDTVSGAWHTENCPGTEFFLRRGGSLLMVNRVVSSGAGAGIKLYTFSCTDALFPPDGVDIVSGEDRVTCLFGEENAVAWTARTGRIFAPHGKNLRLRRVTFAVDAPDAGNISVAAERDGAAERTALKTAVTPFGGLMRVTCRLPSCEFLRLCLAGTGDCRILSMTLEYGEENKRC